MSDLPIDHASDEALHALLDGELESRRREQLAEHLQHCPSCAARLERLEGLFALIESIPEEAFESDLSGAVLRRLPPATRRIPRLAALEATLAAVLMLLTVPWLAALERSDVWWRALLGWSGMLAQELIWIGSRLPTQVHSVLRGLQAATDPGLTLSLPTVPASQLWLLAGSAALLWAVGNGLLLRRPREERS